MPRIGQLRQSPAGDLAPRRWDLSRELFDVSCFFHVANDVYPKLEVFCRISSRQRGTTREDGIPSASYAEDSQFTSIDNAEGTELASQLTGALTHQKLRLRRKPWLTHCPR